MIEASNSSRGGDKDGRNDSPLTCVGQYVPASMIVLITPFAIRYAKIRCVIEADSYSQT